MHNECFNFTGLLLTGPTSITAFVYWVSFITVWHISVSIEFNMSASFIAFIESSLTRNRPFSHCLCACVYRSRGALFLDNRRDFTEMGQTDFKPLIISM